MQRSYESLRAELDDIVARYRGAKDGLTREEAVKRIRQLGFTEGDAERWLGSKPRSTSPKADIQIIGGLSPPPRGPRAP
jgi:hypothetical protein